MSHDVTVHGVAATIEITSDENLVGASGVPVGIRRVEGRLTAPVAGWEQGEERFVEGPTLRGVFRLTNSTTGTLRSAGAVWIKGE